MFRSHNFNLKSISNLWNLRLGAFFQKIHYLYSSFMPHYLKKHPSDQTSCSIAFHLHPFLFSKKSSYLLFLSSCRCSPTPFPFRRDLVLTEQCTNWMCFPCSRSVVVAPTIQFIKGQLSHTLPHPFVLAAMRVISYLCLIFVQQKMQ